MACLAVIIKDSALVMEISSHFDLSSLLTGWLQVNTEKALELCGSLFAHPDLVLVKIMPQLPYLLNEILAIIA